MIRCMNKVTGDYFVDGYGSTPNFIVPVCTYVPFVGIIQGVFPEIA